MRGDTEAAVWLLVPETERLGTAAARVLLLPGGDGQPGRSGVAPNLPCLSLPRGTWVPEGVASLSAQAEARLGVRTTVLRHLLDLGGSHVCEAEIHAAEWSPPPGSRWVTLAELRMVCGNEWAGQHEAAEAIERWFGEQSGALPVPPIRPAWERRGWLDEMLAWADPALARAGVPRTGRPVTVKGAWSGSAILRLPTAFGQYFLKAGYTRPPGEASLVAELSEGWPHMVPELVAWDAARNVMLMRDFGGVDLWGASLPRWENAARSFGQLQMESSRQLSRWLAMGVEDRRPETLPGHFKRLLADQSYLQPGHRQGVTAEEIARAEAAIPRVTELVTRLSESGVPASLVQQDFRHGNLRAVPLKGADARTHRFVYYDWANTVVSHPFFSGTRMLDYLSTPYDTAAEGPSGVSGHVTYASPAFRRYLRDAYVEPWTALLPAAHLRATFDLAWALNPLWQTVRRWLEVPYYEPESPWAKDSLARGPRLLRTVLRSLQES